MQSKRFQQHRKIFNEKVKVFEKTQEAKVNHNTQSQPNPARFQVFRFVDFAPGIEIESGGECQKEKKSPIPAGIKKVTGK